MQDRSLKWYPRIYYDPKNPENLKDFQNRQLFLRIAAEKVPGFALSLFKVTGRISGDWIKRSRSLPPPDREYYIQLFGAIRKWARRYHIEADWVISEAQDIAMVGPLYAQKGIDPVLAFGTWRRALPVKNTHRAFELPAWDPYAETPEAYRIRADREWQRVRDDYIQATSAELERAGLKQVPAPRKRKFVTELRFTWAALHRCSGKSIDELADEYREDTETIRISVSRILKDLGFESPT
jgi:hypothetical protein